MKCFSFFFLLLYLQHLQHWRTLIKPHVFSIFIEILFIGCIKAPNTAMIAMIAEKRWIYQNIWKVDLNCVAQTPSYHKTLQLINLFCAEPRNFNLGFWNKIVLLLEFLLSQPDIIFIFLGFEGVWRLITFLHARRSQCYLLNMNSEHVANIWKSPDPATKSNYP